MCCAYLRGSHFEAALAHLLVPSLPVLDLAALAAVHSRRAASAPDGLLQLCLAAGVAAQASVCVK